MNQSFKNILLKTFASTASINWIGQNANVDNFILYTTFLRTQFLSGLQRSPVNVIIPILLETGGESPTRIGICGYFFLATFSTDINQRTVLCFKHIYFALLHTKLWVSEKSVFGELWWQTLHFYIHFSARLLYFLKNVKSLNPNVPYFQV